MKKAEYPEKVYTATRKTIRKIKRYRWKYRNLLLLALGLVLAYYMIKNTQIISFIGSLGNFGYPAAFLLGMLFTYAFTAVPATVAIFSLGEVLNPILIALIGAVGSVIGNYIIFKLVRDRLLKEINMLSKEVKTLTKPVSALFFWEELRIRIWRAVSRSKVWQVLVPVFAGFILASPIPDEVGVAIFGAIKFNPEKFMVVSYILHFIGILIIAYSARLI